MRPLQLLLLGLVLAAATAAPAAAAPVALPDVLGNQFERVSARTDVPILLPDALELSFDGEVFATSTASRRGWSFSLAGARRCGGATACFLGSLSAERGGRPDYRQRIRLRGGVHGWFKPLSCGASCSPPVVQFRRDGVLYEIAAKASRGELVRAANQALRNGPIDPSVLLSTAQSAPVGNLVAQAGATAGGRLVLRLAGPNEANFAGAEVLAETTRPIRGIISSLRRARVTVTLNANGTGSATVIGPRNATESDSVLTEFTWMAGPPPSIAIVAE